MLNYSFKSFLKVNKTAMEVATHQGNFIAAMANDRFKVTKSSVGPGVLGVSSRGQFSGSGLTYFKKLTYY